MGTRCPWQEGHPHLFVHVFITSSVGVPCMVTLKSCVNRISVCCYIIQYLIKKSLTMTVSKCSWWRINAFVQNITRGGSGTNKFPYQQSSKGLCWTGFENGILRRTFLTEVRWAKQNTQSLSQFRVRGQENMSDLGEESHNRGRSHMKQQFQDMEVSELLEELK